MDKVDGIRLQTRHMITVSARQRLLLLASRLRFCCLKLWRLSEYVKAKKDRVAKRGLRGDLAATRPHDSSALLR